MTLLVMEYMAKGDLWNNLQQDQNDSFRWYNGYVAFPFWHSESETHRSQTAAELVCLASLAPIVMSSSGLLVSGRTNVIHQLPQACRELVALRFVPPALSYLVLPMQGSQGCIGHRSWNDVPASEWHCAPGPKEPQCENTSA